MIRIRQSEIPRFQRCPRSWYLGYELGMTPVREGRRMPASSHRDAGSAYHAGVEAYHKGEPLDSALLAVIHYINETRSIRLEGELPPLTKADDPEWFECARLAMAMVEGYIEWLEETGFDAGKVTQAVEWEWEVDLPEHDLQLYGKADLVLYDSVRGGIIIDDCKTVGPLDVVNPVDFQLRTYAWAWWKLTGEVPVGAGHRQARRVLRSARSKPPYYAYSGIHIDEHVLRMHEGQLVYRAGGIRLTKRGLGMHQLYPNPTKDCSWDCDFKSICPLMDDEDGDWRGILERDFIVKSATE